ncbi:hypothetical protein Sango_2353900 [Sesamum angolense]|uniref:Pentatricopeptide repeat-containing protein n=1 Tax=Sesamum angolense TaxID=2727404 RepID=A0AAE1W619_9LAMI|nr:hypothetical protein Sango_2353900 [Sesamum angolense]
MINQGLRPDVVTYNNLISGLCKMQRIQEAYNLFEKLESEGVRPDTITYNILIGYYCKAGLFEQAYALLDRGVASGLTPNTVTWHILVTNLLKRVTRRVEYRSDLN